MLAEVLNAYGLIKQNCIVVSFGSGLINNTWKISCGNSEYILQRINTNVFKSPDAITNNIDATASYIKANAPHYLFVNPIATKNGKSTYVTSEQQHFRLFPFVKNSHTIDVVSSTQQAYEAAKQFGKFGKLLSAFDATKLSATIPDFHNLTLRYEQFEGALQDGNEERKRSSLPSIQYLQSRKNIADEFDKIRQNKNFKLRVTHHDTKISNVLFNEKNEGLCVIDLDTVMPGYFISDVGDMMRTYLSPASEEEKQFDKIEIRENYFHAIAKGYLSEMKDILTQDEISRFVYAGKFMIYMQALRFLTDYLNNDKYYGAKYPDHNKIRAENQIVLLQKLICKEDELNKITEEVLLTF